MKVGRFVRVAAVPVLAGVLVWLANSFHSATVYRAESQNLS